MSRKRLSKPAWRSCAETEAAKLAPLQTLLGCAPNAWGKKTIIMACREAGAITGEAATLLLQSYQLETA